MADPFEHCGARINPAPPSSCAYSVQPAGGGPVRVRFSVPVRPVFTPAVKAYVSVAAVQLVNVRLAVPTGAMVGDVAALKTPPVVT